jgi:Conserved region of unknown function on GLTSCR protein
LTKDHDGATQAEVDAPFRDKADACKRLLPYHVFQEKVLSQKDLDKADEFFEATSQHLLDKYEQMVHKYQYLCLMESQREVPTSELMMIDRMFLADEQTSLKELKEQAAAAASVVKGVKS